MARQKFVNFVQGLNLENVQVAIKKDFQKVKKEVIKNTINKDEENE